MGNYRPAILANKAHREGGTLKPKLLDLFCGAGGCTKGYQRAGFHVTGVDIKKQPRYCGDEFHQADAMTFDLSGFDFIHASPPCQAFSQAKTIHGRGKHQDLLTPTRERLQASGSPWVIENVPNAPMRKDLILCGTQFGLKDGKYCLIRHRWFEFWKPIMFLVPPCNHSKDIISVFGHGGHIYHGVEQWRRIMKINWMNRDELAQAVPPAYTEFIGRRVLDEIIQDPRFCYHF